MTGLGLLNGPVGQTAANARRRNGQQIAAVDGHRTLRSNRRKVAIRCTSRAVPTDGRRNEEVLNRQQVDTDEPEQLGNRTAAILIFLLGVVSALIASTIWK